MRAGRSRSVRNNGANAPRLSYEAVAFDSSKRLLGNTCALSVENVASANLISCVDVHKALEIAFADDSDPLTLCHQRLGPAVFAALLVPCKLGDVLVSNN